MLQFWPPKYISRYILSPPKPSPPKQTLRLCLGVWRGEEGKVWRGGKYEGKWKNLSNFLKEWFFRE